MFLAFDTETTGLPDWRSPSEGAHQPHLVQLAMILMDADFTERASVSMIIKPEGWTIPDDVAKIHGIDTDLATRFGVPEKQATNLFMAMSYGVGATLIAHNASFDQRIMRIAMLRAGRTKEWLDANPLQDICTMKMALPILNLPPTPKMLAAGFNKPKQPNLTECIHHFFGETLEGAHDALVDVRACLRVFRHLHKPTETVAPPGDVI